MPNGSFHPSRCVATAPLPIIGDALQLAEWQPSGQRSVECIVKRVGSGRQPAGAALPQVIPDGLQPLEHVRRALQMFHPLSLPAMLPGWCNHPLMHQAERPSDVNAQRTHVSLLLKELAQATCSDNVGILRHVPPWLQPAVSNRNIAFMREISAVVGSIDYAFLIERVLGLPPVGWACRAPAATPRTSPPLCPVAELSEGLDAHNRRILATIKSTCDLQLDNESWAKTCQEFHSGVLLGPYDSIADVPLPYVRLVPRRPMWEARAGKPERSCRNIDDMLVGGQNDCTGAQYTHVPADLDQWALLVRRSTERWPSSGFVGFPSDFAKAFRQQTADPATAWAQVVATWDYNRKCTVLGIAVAQLFGGKTAQLNFTRIPAWCCQAVAVLFDVAMIHCVDDMLCIERAETATAAYQSWRLFADLCGWDVPDAKSPPPCAMFRVLGATVDLRALPQGAADINIAEDRAADLVQCLQEILRTSYLSSGSAAQTHGRLAFAATQLYGQLGRAKLKPFIRRQHERGRTNINHQMLMAIKWWLDILQKPVWPRTIPHGVDRRPTVISYSDGEGSFAGVGVAVWSKKLCRPQGGMTYVPECLRQLWKEQGASAPYDRDIYEIEAIGPLLVLHTWPRILQGALWIHFVDNSAALAAIVRGSSSVWSGDVIVGLTWRVIAELQCTPWFERVESSANPVDGLSRGRMTGPWDKVPTTIPDQLRQLLQDSRTPAAPLGSNSQRLSHSA